MRSEKRKLGHLICDARVASWCMLLLFEVYRSLQMSLKKKQYSRMSSRLLPSVADNVLQFIYRYIHLAQAQECFVDFKPSVSLDNNDRTWLEIHSGPEHPLVPALEADEGMRHV